MEAAPTPRPAMNLPANIIGRLPVPPDTDCRMTPMEVINPVQIRDNLRPYLSAIHGVIKQATKHPPWRVDTTRQIC
jgi:hypothetical protein